MCVGGDLTLLTEGSPVSSSYIWGKVIGPLESAGAGGRFLASMLAGAREGNTDWVAHSQSETVELKFESGKTVTMNAADMDSAVLAAYGYSYNSLDGLMSTRGFFDNTTGVLSGPEWTLKDGVLTPPSMTSVTGEVVGNIALDITPNALWLVGGASVLTSNAFDDMIPKAPDERLASKITVTDASSAPISGNPALVRPTQVMDGARLGDFLVEPPRESTAASGTGGSGSAATAAPSSGSLYANELAQEHARSYSESVAQADAAQQAEYTSNQAVRAAAVQARIDAVMAQAEAANARDVGYGPGVPAAPGYGPADVLASGQPAPEVPSASGTGSQQPGLFSRQGFLNDGRVVPNIFKVVNQDLWTAWEKSHGAEAAITFPFVLAMSGAVLLPQSVNDILNIPTLLATALNETDNGNWGKGLEAAGDTLSAVGMLGEFVAGASALSKTAQATETWAGGYNDPWNPINETVADPRIRAQGPAECGLVCGEVMMEGSGVTAQDLMEELEYLWGPDGVTPDSLETAMNALDPKFALDPSIEKPYFFAKSTLTEVTSAELQRLSEQGNWIAGFKGSTGHAVIVEGLSPSGNVMILDPIGGRAYEIVLEEFNEFWTGSGIFRRQLSKFPEIRQP